MKTHQKMCWSCDGHVHVYELQCPYCGADLTEHEKPEEKLEEENSFLEEPDHEEEPEQEEVISYEEHEETIEEEFEKPPFHDLIEEAEPIMQENWEEAKVEAPDPDLENPLASLLLLLPGTLFFLFGLALFLFSHEGTLTFRFTSKYWFVYLLGSWPLLYFGWRSLFPAQSMPKRAVEDEFSESELAEEPEA